MSYDQHASNEWKALQRKLHELETKLAAIHIPEVVEETTPAPVKELVAPVHRVKEVAPIAAPVKKPALPGIKKREPVAPPVKRVVTAPTLVSDKASAGAKRLFRTKLIAKGYSVADATSLVYGEASVDAPKVMHKRVLVTPSNVVTKENVEYRRYSGRAAYMEWVTVQQKRAYNYLVATGRVHKFTIKTGEVVAKKAVVNLETKKAQLTEKFESSVTSLDLADEWQDTLTEEEVELWIKDFGKETPEIEAISQKWFAFLEVKLQEYIAANLSSTLPKGMASITLTKREVVTKFKEVAAKVGVTVELKAAHDTTVVLPKAQWKKILRGGFKSVIRNQYRRSTGRGGNGLGIGLNNGGSGAKKAGLKGRKRNKRSTK